MAILVITFVPHDTALIIVGMFGTILTPAIGTLLVRAVSTTMEYRQADILARKVSIKAATATVDKLGSTYDKVLKELVLLRARKMYSDNAGKR